MGANLTLPETTPSGHFHTTRDGTRGARVAVSRTYLRRHGRLLRKGGADASTHRAVLRARRAPGNGGRLSADRRGRGTGAQGSAHVWHGEAGTRSVARLAHGGGGDACRRGEH